VLLVVTLSAVMSATGSDGMISSVLLAVALATSRTRVGHRRNVAIPVRQRA
jgi:hypothetical protein